MIPYGRQDIDERDIEAVVDVLRSDRITQGPAAEQFEAAVRQACGARHAVAVSSGTAALHLACAALEVGPGDRLWTVPNSFVASANCGRYCGAEVNFADIDPHTWLVDIADLERRLQRAADRDELPRVFVAVHFAGHPCNLAALRVLADRFGFRLVEDAAHALGSRFRGRTVGDGSFSDATIFSFHPVKLITTAEGGMVVTNDESLALRLRELRSHGITRDRARMQAPSDAPWYYEMTALGYNYRLSDLHAALGLSQLRRAEEFVARRNSLAARYAAALADLPLTLQQLDAADVSAFHLFVVRLADGLDRDAVFDALRAAGIGANLHYLPIHLQPYYRALGFGTGDFPVAEAYAAQAITLPLYPAMSETQQDEVIAALRRVLAG